MYAVARACGGRLRRRVICTLKASVLFAAGRRSGDAAGITFCVDVLIRRAGRHTMRAHSMNVPAQIDISSRTIGARHARWNANKTPKSQGRNLISIAHEYFLRVFKAKCFLFRRRGMKPSTFRAARIF
jgi:hypothetical protein